MGVCISVTRLPMGSPTGMSHSCRSAYIFSSDGFLEIGDSSLFLMYAEVAIMQCHAGTIITSVFKSFESFYDNRIGFSVASIANNSTHSIQVWSLKYSSLCLLRERVVANYGQTPSVIEL